MENSEILTLIVGPTKMGKTTLFHFLKESSMKIEFANFGFKIYVEDCPKEQQINNQADSGTKSPNFHGKFCDLPGFNDTRGNLAKLNTTLDLIECLKQTPHFRIILCVEFITLISGSGSQFINITKNLIKRFKLQETHLSSIMIVISKISRDNISLLNFAEMYENEQNFIIEALKTNTIPCFFFENPTKSGPIYKLNEENRISIMDALDNLKYLNSCEFIHPLLNKSKILLIKLRESGSSEIKFISNKNSLDSNTIVDEFLCIDMDFELVDKHLTISSSRIFILPFDKYKKINIKLKGDSKITFSPSIKCLFNENSFFISSENNISDIQFPDPTKSDFDSNENFFRFESICVNSSWTEYASHNNKFLDLIIYLKDCSYMLQKPLELPIKSSMHQIKMKLHINECMRKKDSIKDQFVTMRSCTTIEEFLKKTRKSNISPEFKEILKDYIKKLPSIFQILLDNKNLNNFSKSSSELKDLHRIRSLLIKRYLNLITKIENKEKIELINDYTVNLESFHSFIISSTNLQKNKNYLKSKDSIKRIKRVVVEGLDRNSLNQFLNIFYQLYISNDKKILLDSGLSGDYTIYRNLNIINKVENLNGYDVLGFEALNAGNGIIGAAGITIGFAAVNAGRSLAIRGLGNAAVRAGLGFSSMVAGAIGFGLMALDLGVNLACTALKSGYYSGVLDWVENNGI